jgi:hypothetical protein
MPLTLIEMFDSIQGNIMKDIIGKHDITKMCPSTYFVYKRV